MVEKNERRSYLSSHNDENIIYIENIISRISFDIYNKTGCDYYHLTVVSNSRVIHVLFLDIEIWSSEDDGRSYIDEENNIREDLETYLREKIMLEIIRLHKIVL